MWRLYYHTPCTIYLSSYAYEGASNGSLSESIHRPKSKRCSVAARNVSDMYICECVCVSAYKRNFDGYQSRSRLSRRHSDNIFLLTVSGEDRYVPSIYRYIACGWMGVYFSRPL